MTKDKPTLKDLLVQSMSEERRSLRSHPSRQQLADYRAGTSTAESESSVLAHLGLCRECSDWLLFSRAETSERSKEFEESRLEATADQVATTEKRKVHRERSWMPSFPGWLPSLAGAMVLVLTVLSISQWQRAKALDERWRKAQARLAELEAPRVNVSIFQVRRPSREAKASSSKFEIAPDTQRFVLILPVEGDYDRYEVKILTRDGREVWSHQNARPDSLGVQLRLELSRSFLDGGDYRFEVSAVDNGELLSTKVHEITLHYQQ